MFLDHFTNHHSATFGDDVYFSPNGCKGRRLKENLTDINAIFADFDFKPKQVTGDSKPDFKQFMLDLEDLPEPTFVVESGNGWHLYWCLDEPIKVDDSNREQLTEQVEGTHRYIHMNYGSDSGSIDVLHLLRKPGFEHKKMPDHPVMVEVVVDNEDTKYTLDELIEAMPPISKEVPVIENKSGESDFDIRRVAIDVWAVKGDKVEWDDLGRMIWNGETTGTFIGREGEGNYIATTSDNYPYKGNATTYVAGVLDITTKDAYKWLIGKYSEPDKGQMLGGEIDEKEEVIEERERYLEHLSQSDWSDKDWVKKLKSLREGYFINFYKRVAQLHPHLKYAIDIENLFWEYNPATGVYKELGFQSVRSMVLRALREDELDAYTTDTHVKRVLSNYIAETDQGVTTDDFAGEDDYLHVKNGWLNLTTLELITHSPHRLSLHTVSVNYNPEATCPLYDKMIDDFQMPTDQVRVIDQYSGLILTNDISHQEMLVFDGRPGSGKSLITETWMEVLGHKAENEKLSMLKGDAERFMGESLVGKTLLFFDEANPRTENINESFMKFVSEKTIKIERKGQNKREKVRNTLKVVLALNEMPYHFPPGFDRRYRHILFTRSFRDEGFEDKTLFKRMVDSELSGVLNRMLIGLHDLWKMGGTTVIAGEAERKRQFSLAADDLSAFLSDYFEPDLSYQEVVNGKDMLQAFKEEYPNSFNKSLSQHAFSKKLLSVRLAEFKGVRKDRDRDCRGYSGIKLRAGYSFHEYSKKVVNSSYVDESF